MRTLPHLLAALLLAQAALAADPPMGVSESADGTSVRVWAPNARSVDLVGDFNSWNANGEERLKREGNSGIWSTLLKRSRPKGAYRFLINGDLQRRDPYARAVSADGRSSVFHDPGSYPWQQPPLPSIPLEDLVIYELHVGAFNDPKPEDGRPATFFDAIKRLDYLADLGVNCVQLMPVHEFSGMHSWGYNPSDPFAVEQAYGGPDGLKAFVDACHQRKISVHLDIVHNHYGPENLDLLRFDGAGGATSGGIYFYDAPGIDQTPWGPRVRFDDPQVRLYVKDNAAMWLEEYRVDGFRWDSTVNIRSHSDGRFPIPAGQQMLDDINNFIRDRHPGRWSIAEDSLNIGNFHASWDYDFHHAVAPQLRSRADEDRRVSAIGTALGSQPQMWRVVYVDNHDEAGKINGQARIASDADPSNPSGDFARRMCGLGALLTLTAPGTPLILFGNEMQESGTFHDDRPLDWGKRARHAGLVALHRDLIRLRRDLDGTGAALKGTGIDVPVMDEMRKLLVYARWHDRDPTRQFVIAVNLSGQPMTAAVVPFPSAGPWITRIYTDWSRYGGTTKEDPAPFRFEGSVFKGRVALAPYSARLFTPAPGGPAAREAPPAAVTAAPEEPKAEVRAFSMYASINLVGSFNDWNLTAWPLKREKGLVWERRVTFAEPTTGEFRLSANDSGQVFWGGEWNAVESVPYQSTLSRLGPNIKITRPLQGDFLFRFDEPSLSLTIEPAAPEPAAAPAFRAWTDARGARIEARLLGVNGDQVVLQKRDGARIQVRLGSLSAEDQRFIAGAAQ